MARPKLSKNMTPGERRSAKAGVKVALKAVTTELKSFVKAKADAQREYDKTAKLAIKTRDLAVANAEKREAAATKGVAKLEAQLAALDAE